MKGIFQGEKNTSTKYNSFAVKYQKLHADLKYIRS